METVTDLLGDPVPATPAMTDPLPFRVFRINDCDWVMARTLDEALKYYESETGYGPEDADDARELTDTELDSLKFFTEDVDESGETIVRTFREELAISARSATGPQLFASTEY